MSSAPKMKLKLNTGQTAHSSQAAPTPTPSSTTSGLKINFKNTGAGSPPQPSTPLIPQTAKVKITKATTSNPKKRVRDVDDDFANDATSKKQATTTKINLSQKPVLGKAPIIKLKAGPKSKSTPTTPSSAQPRIKIRARGKIPPRPVGVGYDSEAEDAEPDPANEENLILRMAPGPDCDYLRKAIEDRKVGVPVSQGGADVSIRFFTRDGRRAVVNVRGSHYAAILVDLPCITESMKSWDKRGWWKSADICQMLLVIQPVHNEEAAKVCPLPKDLDQKTWQWPHGLTPPMHNVRNRRFRKRVSHRTIEAAEEEVERLLAADEHAKALGGSSHAETLDLDALRREELGDDAYDEYEDAEGDPDEEMVVEDEEEEMSAEQLAMMEQMLAVNDDEDVAAPPTGTSAAPTPTIEAESVPHAESNVEPTGVAGQDQTAEYEEEDDDEEDEEDEEEEEEEEEVDEEAREKAAQVDAQKEEIAYLEAQLTMQREAYDKSQNAMVRQRAAGRIKSFEADLQVKRRALGVGDEDA